MSGRRKKIFKLDSNVFFLGLTSLFADISSEMVYPYLVVFLASALHVSAVSIGFIEGLAESTASVSKFFSGWFSDKLRRRKELTVGGYLVGVFSRPLLALTRTWPQVAFLRFFDRLGKGIRTSPRDALIADVTVVSDRGRAFGLHRTLDTVGAILGPAAAWLVLFFFGSHNYRLLFLAAGLPAALAVLIVAVFVREKKAPAAEDADESPDAMSKAKLSGTFKFYIFIAFIFALGNSSNVFIILRAENLGVSALMIAPLYLIFNVTYALLSTPAGIASDRLGRRAVIVSGYLCFALVYLALAVIKNTYWLPLLFMAYGFYPALTEGAERALAADLVPVVARGTGIGVFHFAVGLAAFPASIIGGLLWRYINPAATFYYGAATALSAAFLLLFILKSSKISQK